MKKNLFTTTAVDNIDHNPSSSIASDSFHGTGISLLQHPTREEKGEPREDLIPYSNGAIGLTENSFQLLRWMVSGPETARLISQFQSDVSTEKDETIDRVTTTNK